ncbi:hypothetical protein [Ruegeria hyattellae]|uniref:hypothetical protein n=1 Tax=Ruegeria hyattellae TaxID=3233337 RepID=UPI00355BFD9B
MSSVIGPVRSDHLETFGNTTPIRLDQLEEVDRAIVRGQPTLNEKELCRLGGGKIEAVIENMKEH